MIMNHYQIKLLMKYTKMINLLKKCLAPYEQKLKDIKRLSQGYMRNIKEG